MSGKCEFTRRLICKSVGIKAPIAVQWVDVNREIGGHSEPEL